MGVEGLLALFKGLSREKHVGQLAPSRVGVDAMNWLYRGLYGCVAELGDSPHPQHSPPFRNQYLRLVSKMVAMLRQHSLEPVMVFDGRRLGAKKDTNDKRKKIRRENHAKAEQCFSRGQKEEGVKYLQRSIHISKQMIYVTIELLKRQEVQVIIAPYEADAQLAHLARTGQVGYVATEDSDLILYGAPRLLFKL